MNADDIAAVVPPGICYLSACVPIGVPDSEIEEAANQKWPTGVGPWKLSTDKAFRGGEPNPCPCNHSTARVHVLLECVLT